MGIGSISAWRQDKASGFSLSLEEWGCWQEMLEGRRGKAKRALDCRAEQLSSAPGFVAWFLRLYLSRAEARKSSPFLHLARADAGVPQSAQHRFEQKPQCKKEMDLLELLQKWVTKRIREWIVQERLLV